MEADELEKVMASCLRRLWRRLAAVVADYMSYRDTHDEPAITARLVIVIRREAEEILSTCIGSNEVSVGVEAWNTQHSSSDEGRTGADIGIVVSVGGRTIPKREKVAYLQAKRLDLTNADWVLKLSQRDSKGRLRAKRQACSLKRNYPRRAGGFLLYGPTEFGTRVAATDDILGSVHRTLPLDDALRMSTPFEEWMGDVHACPRGSRNKCLVSQVKRLARQQPVRSRKAVKAAAHINIEA